MIRLAGSVRICSSTTARTSGNADRGFPLPRARRGHEIAEDRVRREPLARLGPGVRGTVDREPLEEAGQDHRPLGLAEGEPVAEPHQLGLDRRGLERRRVAVRDPLRIQRVEIVQGLHREPFPLGGGEAEPAKGVEPLVDEVVHPVARVQELGGEVDLPNSRVRSWTYGATSGSVSTRVSTRSIPSTAQTARTFSASPPGEAVIADQGAGCRARVPLGEEGVGVVPDRPVALVHDEQGHVLERGPPAEAVVLDHLGSGEADSRSLPAPDALGRRRLAREERERVVAAGEHEEVAEER